MQLGRLSHNSQNTHNGGVPLTSNCRTPPMPTSSSILRILRIVLWGLARGSTPPCDTSRVARHGSGEPRAVQLSSWPAWPISFPSQTIQLRSDRGFPDHDRRLMPRAVGNSLQSVLRGGNLPLESK